MINSIIFDFDGVIHDTITIGYNINKIRDPNLTLDGYKDFFNGNLFANFNKQGEKKEKQVLDEFYELQEKEFENLRIEEGIKEELLKLNSRFNLFIVTSNKEITLKKYFENNNLTFIFKEILGLETHKSKEEKFKILINKYKMNKQNSIFITDTLGDILEANRMNLNTIAVDFGFHERKRLEKGNPIKIVSTFREILPSIEEISKIAQVN